MRYSFAWFAATVLVLAGCIGGGGGGGSGGGNAFSNNNGGSTSAAPPPQRWTVVVYGHADHNLSYNLALDLSEMSRARIGEHLQVVVIADWDVGRHTEWYRIRGWNREPALIHAHGEQDFDDPQVLRESIANAFAAYPAERRGLILWDHGGAWEGGFGGDTQDGTREGRPMTAADAAAAVRAALAAQGIQRLDFLAFDTCLMAGAEVAAEVADLAQVYLACAELDFGDGWDYETTLTWLSAHSRASAPDFARAEVAHWDAHHQTDSDRLAKSHVALDLAAWSDFAAAMRGVAQAFGSAHADRLALGRAYYGAVPGYGWYWEDALEPKLRDAGAVLAAFAQSGDAALAMRAQAAQQALGRLRLALAQGSLRQGQSGLHLEAALAYTYTEDAGRLERYRARAPAWRQQSGWDALLATLAGWDDGVPPALSLTEAATARAITVTVASSDADLADGGLRVERHEEGDWYADYGLVAYGLRQPGTATYAWDRQLVHLGDGAGAWRAGSIDPVVVGGDWSRLILGMWALLSDGTEAVAGWIAFGASDAASDLFIGLDSDDMLFAWRLEPGWRVTPILWRFDGADWEPVELDDLTVPASRRLLLERRPAPAGAYRLRAFANDLWGNYAEAIAGPQAITRR